MIIHDLKLDICPNMKRNEVWVSQYDTDFLIRITLFASKGTFTVESGTTAAIRGTKPDGNGYSANASVSGNVVTVTGAEQMTVVAGRSVYEVTLYRNGKELNTVNFNLRVEHAALDKDTPTSRSQTRELVSIEEHADEIIENVRNMEVFAGDSEAYALGTRKGVAVESDDPAYQNNSKWYAEQNIPDTTLAISGRPADAKATGDQLTSIKDDLSEETTGDEFYPSVVGGYTKVNGYFSQEAKFDLNSNCRTFYIGCLPNTKYTISKTASTRFRAGYTTEELQNKTAIHAVTINDLGTSLTVTTGADAKYLVVFYYNSSSDSMSESVLLQSISIAQAYISANDKYARENIAKLTINQELLCNEIPDTTQVYAFTDGAVSRVTHSRNETAIRTDVFTYGESTITEVRTLNTGESLTIVTNLTTLETSVTFAAA